MLHKSKSLFALTAIACALAFGGCDCGADTGGRGDGSVLDDAGGNGGDGGGNNGDGGGNGGDGAVDDGGGNGGDGGGNGGDGGTNIDGGTTPVCLTAADVCPGKCGTFSDNCAGVINCQDAAGMAAGGLSCGNTPGSCLPDGSACTPDGGVSVCVPTESCASVGQTCGSYVDPIGTCGIPLNCWPAGMNSCPAAGSACVSPAPGVKPQCVTGTPACSGTLCGSLPTNCTAQNPTTLSGTVVTPGRNNGTGIINRVPVPNAVVYIPGSPGTALPSIFEGVDNANPLSCGRCTDEKFVADGQSVLASAITNERGEFVLSGRIPVGVAFNIVIKVGKWRRVVQIPSNVANACANANLTVEQTRLNATTTDGLTGTHLPHIAVSTGYVDAMECVLRNIGISESEFSVPSGNGRIHMYRGSTGGGARMATATCTGSVGGSAAGGTCQGTTTWSNTNHNCSDSRTVNSVVITNYGCQNGRAGCYWSNGAACPSTALGCNYETNSCFNTNIVDQTVDASNLIANQAALNAYDMVVFDCEGGAHQHDTQEPALVSYVDHGGRMFASHFAYTWIENNGTLDASADWGDGGTSDLSTGFISLPTGTTPQTTDRTRANAVKSPLFFRWLDYQGALVGTVAGLPLEAPTAPQFAITDARDRAGANAGASTDEWVYRTTDGTVGGPARIQQLSFNTPYAAAPANVCGRVAYTGFHVALDDAGATIDNSGATDIFPAVCPNGVLRPQELSLVFMLFDLNSCVSTGDPVVPPTCTPLTAADVCPTENSACNYLSDGCGGVVDCGSCDPGYYCSVNSCIMAPPPCVPKTCAQLNASYVCGSFPDGCGGIADGAMMDTCGSCGGGTPICGPNGTCVGNCTPLPNPCGLSTCGSVSNGCGATVYCGPYPMGGCAPTDMCIDNGMGVKSCQFIIE